MRELINIVAESAAVRLEWHVLLWGGEGWNWSDPMDEETAKREYARQVRMTPGPSKLICVSTVAEDSGENATPLNVPASKRG